MQQSPVFFIGLAILILFGVRMFLFCAFLYILYIVLFKGVIRPKKKKESFEDVLSAILKNIFDQSKVEEAKIIKKPTFSSPNILPMFTPKRIVSSLIGLAFILLLLDGFVSVPAGHVAVILDRGRGVLEESLPTGLHLKVPFWQKATIMDTRLQTYTMSIAPSEGDKYGDDAIEALTKDGQQVRVDVTVQFFLSSTKASRIYDSVGLDYVDKIVRPAARSVIRNVITGFNSKELFQIETRQAAQDLIKEEMTKNFLGKNLELDDILLRNVQFSETYLQAIEDKQVAEQKIQKAEFEKQEAEIRKEKLIIEAEAEAEAIKLKGASLRQNPEVIQLEMVQKLSPNINWGVLSDGVLPLLDLKQ